MVSLCRYDLDRLTDRPIRLIPRPAADPPKMLEVILSPVPEGYDERILRDAPLPDPHRPCLSVLHGLRPRSPVTASLFRAAPPHVHQARAHASTRKAFGATRDLIARRATKQTWIWDRGLGGGISYVKCPYAIQDRGRF